MPAGQVLPRACRGYPLLRKPDPGTRHREDRPPLPEGQPHGGQEANVIAWLWARTVASPNPAVQGAHVPLISTYWLSSKKGQLAWLKPVIDRNTNSWCFTVQIGVPANKKLVSSGTKAGKGSKFTCLLTGVPIRGDYIQEQGRAGRIGYRLIAVIADLGRGRTYLPASDQTTIVEQAAPDWYPPSCCSAAWP